MAALGTLSAAAQARVAGYDEVITALGIEGTPIWRGGIAVASRELTQLARATLEVGGWDAEWPYPEAFADKAVTLLRVTVTDGENKLDRVNQLRDLFLGTRRTVYQNPDRPGHFVMAKPDFTRALVELDEAALEREQAEAARAAAPAPAMLPARAAGTPALAAAPAPAPERPVPPWARAPVPAPMAAPAPTADEGNPDTNPFLAGNPDSTRSA